MANSKNDSFGEKTFIMDFGRWCGSPLQCIPLGYLRWMLAEEGVCERLGEEMTIGVCEEVKRRQGVLNNPPQRKPRNLGDFVRVADYLAALLVEELPDQGHRRLRLAVQNWLMLMRALSACLASLSAIQSAAQADAQEQQQTTPPNYQRQTPVPTGLKYLAPSSN